MDVKSADKKPEKYVGSDGKPRVRMVPVDKQVIKKEAKVDELSMSLKDIRKTGLNKAATKNKDQLKKDLERMKDKLTAEETIIEATDMSKLKQLATAGLVKKGDVQKLLRVFGKMESGKTVTPAEREMLLGVLSDMTALITGDMSMLQKAKKAVKEEAELDEVKRGRSTMRRLKDIRKDAENFKPKRTKKEEAYRKPTQAEIDADKKKENAGKKRPSMDYKSVKKSVYKNMMGGLKKEDYKSEYAHHTQGLKDAKADMKAAKTNSDMVKAMNKKAHHSKALSKMNRMESVKTVDEVLDTPKAMQSYRDKNKASKEKAASSAVAKIVRSKDKDNREHPAAELKTMAKRRSGEKMADRLAGRKTLKLLRKGK